MSEYGVKGTGFVRKPLDVILADQEAAMRAAFGAKIIQTPQSPAGQFNGVFSEMVSDLWELAQDVYQSYDPTQSEGVRLETLAKLRLLEKLDGETDVEFQQAITNQNVARVDEADFSRALLAVDGVFWGRIYENSTGETDANGLPRNSVSVAAIGGSDADVAEVARLYTVPGITLYGNVQAETLVAGYCRSMKIIRPAERRVRVELTLTKSNDSSGCPPPNDASVAAMLAASTTGQTRPANGVDASMELVRRMIESAYANVSVTAVRFAFDDEVFGPGPLALTFFEIMSIAAEDVDFT